MLVEHSSSTSSLSIPNTSPRSVLLSRVAYSLYLESLYRLHGTAVVKRRTLTDSEVELRPLSVKI